MMVYYLYAKTQGREGFSSRVFLNLTKKTA